MNENIGENWTKLRIRAMAMLQEEAELQEIVRLVGYDALSEKDQLKLEIARSIREDYLQQNAFHEVDSYASFAKQYKMLQLVLSFEDMANKALDAGIYLKDILALEERDKIARAKYIPETDLDRMDAVAEEVQAAVDRLISEGGIANA